MGIPELVSEHLYIETGPRELIINISKATFMTMTELLTRILGMACEPLQVYREFIAWSAW